MKWLKSMAVLIVLLPYVLLVALLWRRDPYDPSWAKD